MLMMKVQKAAEILLKDHMILNIVNFRIRRNRVNLHWAPVCEKKFGALVWKKDTDFQNLGDMLAEPIYEYMLKRNGLDKDAKVSKTKHLYTIGSLIMLAYQDATIWGSGILLEEPAGFIWKRSKSRKLDVRCVRGPRTMKRLQENGYDVSNCVMGDPGVLMPLIYKPEEREKKDYVVIRHMSKKTGKSYANEVNIITNDWKETINQIYNSKLVISSSLHGLILAEAYGIPAILLDNTEFGDHFKYQDYYMSTGRTAIPACKTVEEALKAPIPAVPDLSGLQENLLRSFPVDLWAEETVRKPAVAKD
ncbi:pyruvyltransferase [Lachnospiraceae bacterium KH1T2]|nr:pyruvyltransferase [Lachnospiraceae bacterium KH1T2]